MRRLYISPVLVWLCLTLPTVVSAQGPPGIVAKYLGVAGWEITDGRTVILIDPYISRLSGPPATEGPSPEGWPSKLTQDDLAIPDTTAIEQHIGRADYILLTHGHYVHLLDAPYIARTRHATIVGNESVANIARAYGVPDEQIITVRGGEDFEFSAFSLRVVPSLHSAIGPPRYYFSSKVAPRGLKPPLRFGDFVEGGTVAYLIRFGGHKILVFGSMNYIEREIEGLRPDVALIPASPLRLSIHEYSARLMRALGSPPLVLATHWDSSGVPYTASHEHQYKEAEAFASEVKAASPRTKVVIPRHFEPIPLPTPARE
jgi:L-ascorbate metabolism protein UlaG (beta-lactamase superfamily)